MNYYLIDRYKFPSYIPAKWQIPNQRLKELDVLLGNLLVNKARKSRYKKCNKKNESAIEGKRNLRHLNSLPKLNSELMKIAKTGIIKNRTHQETFQE